MPRRHLLLTDGSIGPVKITGRQKQVLAFCDRDGYPREILAHFINDDTAARFEELLRTVGRIE